MVIVHAKLMEGKILLLYEIAAEQSADLVYLRAKLDPAP